ncbi:hypothetical protein STREPTOSP366_65380 [Streptomyces variabilis]
MEVLTVRCVGRQSRLFTWARTAAANSDGAMLSEVTLRETESRGA